MADEVDLAQQHNEMHLNISLAQHLSRPTEGRMICIDCEEPIPQARRRANPAAQRCIACQREFEAKR